MKDRKTEKRWRKNERNHGCTVAYADDFVTERKSIASLDRFDCIQFKMKFDFFPLNYTFKFFTDTCTFSPHIVVRVLHFSLSSLLRTCSMDQDPLFKLSAKKLLGIHFRLQFNVCWNWLSRMCFIKHKTTWLSLAFIHFVRPSTVRVI